MTRLFLAFFALLLCQPAAAEVSKVSDIAYGQHRLQKLDVYAPARCPAGGCPVVIWVHGGGWRMGSKDMRGSEALAATWTKAGAILVSTNYRLSPDAVHPAHAQDIAASVNWVHKNIEAYGGSPRRVFLLGHSAGAHLVALVGTDPQYLAAHGLHPADALAGVFPIDSASYDLSRSIDDRHVGRMVAQAFGTSPTALAAASPLTYAKRNRDGRYPRFTMAAAKIRDEAVRQMNEFVEQLQRSGGVAFGITVDYGTIRSELRAHMEIAKDLADPNHAMTQRLMREVGLDN